MSKRANGDTSSVASAPCRPWPSRRTEGCWPRPLSRTGSPSGTLCRAGGGAGRASPGRARRWRQGVTTEPSGYGISSRSAAEASGAERNRLEEGNDRGRVVERDRPPAHAGVLARQGQRQEATPVRGGVLPEELAHPDERE